MRCIKAKSKYNESIFRPIGSALASTRGSDNRVIGFIHSGSASNRSKSNAGFQCWWCLFGTYLPTPRHHRRAHPRHHRRAHLRLPSPPAGRSRRGIARGVWPALGKVCPFLLFHFLSSSSSDRATYTFTALEQKHKKNAG